MKRAIITSIGIGAAEVLAVARQADMVALFDRSLLLRAREGMVCLGAPDIGQGPLNILLASADDWTAVRAAAVPCARWSLEPQRLATPDLEIDLAGATVWQPSDWPPPAPPARIRAAARALDAIILQCAPAEGLARLIASGGQAVPTPVARAAVPRVGALRRWLGAPQPGDAPPVELLGLGPGATPSGDDVLAGVLLALDALADHEFGRRLGAAIGAQAAMRTTPLSVALLGQAAQGRAADCLTAVVAALVSGEAEAVGPVALTAGRYGHSSGWDTLAGMSVALSARLDASGARSTGC